MRVAACQMREIIGEPAQALALIERNARDAERRGARLVCFPECYLQGYVLDPAHVAATALDLESNEFRHVLERLGHIEATLVIGIIERAHGAFYNTAIVVTRGELVGCYRKTYLLNSERRVLEPGDRYPIFRLDELTFGINICNDLNFGAAQMALANAGAKLVVCPAGNMLTRANAEQWKHRHNAIRVERAKSAKVWLLSSDVTGSREGRIAYGPTALIDPLGNVVAQVPLMEEGILVADVQF